jgi:hypothetical protein
MRRRAGDAKDRVTREQIADALIGIHWTLIGIATTLQQMRK